MTTLLHERGTLGFALTAHARGAVGRLLEVLASGRGRDALAARARRARVDRAAGAPLHELPLAGTPRAHRRPRPRGLGREAALVGGEPAADEARARAARARTALLDDGWWQLTSSSAAAATRSRPAPPRSSATSSPSACSACRGRADGLLAHRRAAGAEARRRALARGPLPARPRLGADRPTAGGARLAGVVVAEEDGGAGLGFVEEALLLEELGCALPRPLPRDVARAAVAGRRAAGRGRGRRASWSVELGRLVP